MPVRAASPETLSRLKDFEPKKPPKEVVLERDFAIEPWLFCGGQEPRKHDSVQRVRPTSVLGQLRFFWRLLAQPNNLAALKEKEARYFGAASQPAPFRMEIKIRTSAKPILIGNLTRGGDYIAFPARSDRETEKAELSAGIRFGVTLRGDIPSEVVAAFDVWTILGGVGGRTRRGLGAVQADPSPFGDQATLAARLKVLFENAPRTPKCEMAVRSVQEIWLTEKNFLTSTDCLFALEKWYKNYRQDRRPGSDPRRPGRSFWDEPELIRNLTGRREKKHQCLPLPQGCHAGGWARGILGLPIVFKFQGDRFGDPQQTLLQGQSHERFASALIFRPVRLQNGRAVGVVARLSEPYLPPGGFKLNVGNKLLNAPPTSDSQRVWNDLFQSGESALQLRRIW